MTRDRHENTPPGSHRCPHDRTALPTVPADSEEVATCTTCDGLWLPGRLVDRRIGRPPALSASFARTAVRCPEDGVPLRALQMRDVEVDVCPGCGGVWLDRGELAKLRSPDREGLHWSLLEIAVEFLESW